MSRRNGTWRRLAVPLAWLAVVFAAGVLGYLALGLGPVDAFSTTVFVLTTIGFGARAPIGAVEKVFTASLAALGVSAYLAILAGVAGAIAEGQLGIASRRRRMDRKIGALKDHFVICAYGRVGRAVAREFEGEGMPFVVIDRKEELEDQMRLDGVLYLIGDPTAEVVLRRAGIERAKGLVCAVDSDADNVYIALTGRSLNPGIFIVARASASETPDRLYRAGANRVISPYVASGRHMALLALRPRVVDYLEMLGPERPMRLEELVVEEGSPLVGRLLADAVGAATPLVVCRTNGETVAHPDPGEALRAGDLVVLLGEPKALRPVEGG
ncbi:MAG: potassium channel protein [Acidobacteria bacterium]|nr:potassium channel protein [Acidobacteriota bacterium]